MIQCPVLPRPANGMVTISSQDRRIGSTATFQCNFEYRLTGQARLVCQESEEWSAQAPTCQSKTHTNTVYSSHTLSLHSVIECPPLSQPLNGEVQENSSRAVYTCNADYDLVGAATLTCQLNGVWSTQPPTCERMSYILLIL